jgi:type II secretory pathway predicted ATPase ExeA
MPASQPPASPSRPFTAAPAPSRYFPASAIEEARLRIGRSVKRGEGPVLVIGAGGLGKTMLLEVVAQQFRETLAVALLPGGQLCTRRALLQMVLFQLGLPYQEMDESELRISLLSYLQPQGSAAKRLLLLVDEADAIPQRLLEELRSLTNLSSDGELLVSLVLAGNASLEEQFADPKLELFSQRVSARCYLSAFGREETFQYLKAQVAAGRHDGGHDPQTLFTDDGLEAIFAVTDGVPRIVNQLGDQLLWGATEAGRVPLDGPTVQLAWSELQQLPAPWNTHSSERAGAAVEFGELDAGDIEVDQIVFADDSLEASFDTHFDSSSASSHAARYDLDDEMPASIPINAPQPPVQPLGSTTLQSTAIDFTQQLLDQLEQMHDTPAQPPAALPHNPFDESFESEEVVLDRYSSFERLLLASAPKVSNQSDSAFSQQLQSFETAQPAAAPQTVALQPVAPPAVAPQPAAPVAPVPVADVPAPSTWMTAEMTAAETLGEILVIDGDDEHDEQTEVVRGHQFRQLFSRLETGSTCVG